MKSAAIEMRSVECRVVIARRSSLNSLGWWLETAGEGRPQRNWDFTRHLTTTTILKGQKKALSSLCSTLDQLISHMPPQWPFFWSKMLNWNPMGALSTNSWFITAGCWAVRYLGMHVKRVEGEGSTVKETAPRVQSSHLPAWCPEGFLWTTPRLQPCKTLTGACDSVNSQLETLAQRWTPGWMPWKA